MSRIVDRYAIICDSSESYVATGFGSRTGAARWLHVNADPAFRYRVVRYRRAFL